MVKNKTEGKFMRKKYRRPQPRSTLGKKNKSFSTGKIKKILKKEFSKQKINIEIENSIINIFFHPIKVDNNGIPEFWKKRDNYVRYMLDFVENQKEKTI